MQLYAVVKVYEVKGQTKVEVPCCSNDVDAVQKERERLLAARTPGTIISTVEVGSWQLSKAGMLEVCDAYDHECVRTTVLYTLQSRYPGLDETRPDVQELIHNIADHAFADIYKGVDEDSCVDAAFRYFGKEVDEVCGAES